MNLLQRVLGLNAYAVIRRQVYCRLGLHGPRNGPDGKPGNVCCWGCGLVYNQAMWKEYIVTLKDGQEYEVKATNEYHAGSVVVYGNFNGRTLAIDGHTGKPLGCEMKVHRENIASIYLKPNS